MSRTPLVVGLCLFALAVCAVGATVGTAVGTAGTGPAETDAPAAALAGELPLRVENVSNTTNYLFPADSVERQSYATANVDVGSAVAASATQLGTEHEALTLDERLASQPSDSGDRLGVAEGALADAEARMERLDEAHGELFRAYNNGSLSRGQFVRELVQLDVRATAYSEYLDSLEGSTRARLDGSLPANFESRLSELRSQAVVLPTPLTDRTRATLLGTAAPFVLYAEGVDDALVLGAVDDGTFYRQATIRSAYRPDEPSTLSIEGALQRATELYPWVYSGGQGFQPQIGIAGPGLFRVSANHPQGNLVSYISGSTSDVFLETQTLDPADVPVYDVASNGTESLNLSVTTTTVTGPMRVDLTTPAGVPVNGTVFVNGEPVDTTGEDGTLWTVRPSGTFSLRAVSEAGAEASLSRIRFLRTSS